MNLADELQDFAAEPMSIDNAPLEVSLESLADGHAMAEMAASCAACSCCVVCCCCCWD